MAAKGTLFACLLGIADEPLTSPSSLLLPVAMAAALRLYVLASSRQNRISTPWLL
jgi:hypothetical protein